MTTRTVHTDTERKLAADFVASFVPPFTLTLTKGAKRSVDQNRLNRLWVNEIAEQLGDQSPEEVRGFCKLTVGVPILRAENERFCEEYDRLIRPMSYEDKISIMQLPLDFAVTRLMTTKQFTSYLDALAMYWAGKGIRLTMPDER